MMRWFGDGSHLDPLPQAVSQCFTELAGGLLDLLPDDPELTASLRKLLEAKDCAVRLAFNMREGI